MDDENLNLKPCPFCGSGETILHRNTHWTGQRSIITSAIVQHWCGDERFKSFLQLKGKTEEEAIERWNTRAMEKMS